MHIDPTMPVCLFLLDFFLEKCRFQRSISALEKNLHFLKNVFFVKKKYGIVDFAGIPPPIHLCLIRDGVAIYFLFFILLNFFQMSISTFF